MYRVIHAFVVTYDHCTAYRLAGKSFTPRRTPTGS